MKVYRTSQRNSLIPHGMIYEESSLTELNKDDQFYPDDEIAIHKILLHDIGDDLRTASKYTSNETLWFPAGTLVSEIVNWFNSTFNSHLIVETQTSPNTSEIVIYSEEIL